MAEEFDPSRPARRPDTASIAEVLLGQPGPRRPRPKPMGGHGTAVALLLVASVVSVAAIIIGYLFAPELSFFAERNSSVQRLLGWTALVAAPFLPVGAGWIGRRTSGSPVWFVLGIVFALPLAGLALFVANEA